MAKVNKNKIIRDLNDVRAGQTVRVLNYRRRPDGFMEVERGGLVTVQAVERFGDRVNVLDVLGVVASNKDNSTKLERV